MIAPELARTLSEISRSINRQIGILLDRRGRIRVTVVGDAHSIFLPDLTSYRVGHARFCGLRLIHTHLKPSPLDNDDLTDLALLRLDLVAAIEVEPDGLPGRIHVAHLLPANEEGTPWQIVPPQRVQELPDDFESMISSLEQEFTRKRAARKSETGRDRAIVIHVSTDAPAQVDESLSELKELARSAGIDVVAEIRQRRSPDPRYVMGRGKLQGVIIQAMQAGAEVLLFDRNLTPAQVKHISEFSDIKALDRSQVILDIFAQRAQEREAKLQVELAQLRYLLPRLSGKHTAMSRLTGGIGGRGPGETKLEIDQRRARARITQLQREVEKLGGRRRLRRKRRTDRKIPIVSIVGYTNAGKSTLLNRLTDSTVAARDELFATLNPVSRRIRFPQEREVIVTDTVGFIRDLPETLMAAFRTTFEEIASADLILLVLDAANPEVDHQNATVMEHLRKLGVHDVPMLTVLNKSDLCETPLMNALVMKYRGVPISALNRDTFTPLLEEMEARLWSADDSDHDKANSYLRDLPEHSDANTL